MGHTDYFHIIPPWHVYVDGKPLVSFLVFQDAVGVVWDLMQNGRNAVLVRKPEHGGGE